MQVGTKKTPGKLKRFFNVAGPCFEQYHYMLPAAERLPVAPRLIDEGAYFVVHAPRQTGKTTTLRALAEQVTEQGEYAALYFSCEAGSSFSDDIAQTQRAILDEIRECAQQSLPEELQPPPWPEVSDGSLIRSGLAAWARTSIRPLVLLVDEIDSLKGQSLISVLRQLRAAYPHRPEGAPWSVILCGLRDVRDYKAASGGNPGRLNTSSPFNIKTDSVRLGNFDAIEIGLLYGQHTEETGQVFTEEAVQKSYALSAGQPWLVNALAREVIVNMGVTDTIYEKHMSQAGERLILARATHLDSLVARLSEPRVHRVIETILSGGMLTFNTYDDDASYVRDLGLINMDKPPQITNPIYREVIARVLAAQVQDSITLPERSFVGKDGRLDLRVVLEEFSEFWTEHGEILANGILYHEVAPQLVLMAYLQRVVNGGGFVEREYGVGRGRIDVLVRWPHDPEERNLNKWQREALELKVWAEGKPDPIDKGLVQIEGYLERLGLKEGCLVLFDRRPEALPIQERTTLTETKTSSGKRILLLRA